MTVTPIEQARTHKPATRIPPHNLDAERALLGAVLVRPGSLDEAATIVTPTDFYKPAHGHIYAAAEHLNTRAEPVDPVTVAAQLNTDGLLDTCGGLEQLIVLAADTPTTDAARYARIVADKAVLRQLIAAAGEIAETAYNDPETGPAVEHAEQIIYQLAAGRRHTTRSEPAHDVILRAVDRLEEGHHAGTPTGFVDLDHKLLGLHKGQLVTVCARPGMGKTSFGTQLAVNIAVDAQAATLLASIEMSIDEISMRLLASEARVDLQRIRGGHIADRDWPHIGQAAVRLSDEHLWFLDAATVTLAGLRSEIRRLSARTPLMVVIVDYLQLVNVEDRRDNRQVDVSQISAGLKRIAREFDLAVVALAQLSRSCELRADKRPILSDLRESGAIENDSDVVIGIYRDDYYNPDSPDRGAAELVVMKQRSGPTGTVRVAWHEMYARFSNVAQT